MKNAKRISVLTSILILCTVFISISVCAATYGKITIYNGGAKTEVSSEDLQMYLDSGWKIIAEPVMLYYSDGSKIYVEKDEISVYEKKGWKAPEKVTMYAADGRTKEVEEKDVTAYQQVGWFKTKPVLMYTLDDRTKYVESYDVEAYKKVGWYTEKQVLMYALDGRTIYVSEKDVDAYKNVGWYVAENVSMVSADGREITVYNYQVADYEKVGWLVKKIKMYHADSSVIEVTEAETKSYSNQGWFYSKPVLLYTKYGDVMYVEESEVERICAGGQYFRAYNTLFKTDNGINSAVDMNYKRMDYIGYRDDAGIYISSSNKSSVVIPSTYPVYMYTDSGKKMFVGANEVQAYKNVGWKEAYRETLLALNQNRKNSYDPQYRELKIYNCDVQEYIAVGWNKAYDIVKNLYNNTIKNKNYEQFIFDVHGDGTSFYRYNINLIEKIANPDEALSANQMKTQIMDLYRKQINGPLAAVSWKTSENSIGTPQATIYFRNVSYKKIVGYKIQFDLYDIFGNREYSYYDYYYDDDCNIETLEYYGATWTLYGADSVNKITNIRVTEVVYEDGTKWYR